MTELNTLFDKIKKLTQKYCKLYNLDLVYTKNDFNQIIKLELQDNIEFGENNYPGLTFKINKDNNDFVTIGYSGKDIWECPYEFDLCSIRLKDLKHEFENILVQAYRIYDEDNTNGCNQD